MRTISFSVSDEQHAMFGEEATCKGMSVSAYCKMAAFSHLAKYASRGPIAEKMKLFKKRAAIASDPTNVESGGISEAGH